MAVYIAMKSQDDDCDEEYVIDSISSDHPYLHGK